MTVTDEYTWSLLALLLQLSFLIQIRPAFFPARSQLRFDGVYLPQRSSAAMRESLRLSQRFGAATLLIGVATAILGPLLGGSVSESLFQATWFPVALFYSQRIGNLVVGRTRQRSLWPSVVLFIADGAWIVGLEAWVLLGWSGAMIGAAPALFFLRLPFLVAGIAGSVEVATVLISLGWIVSGLWCFRYGIRCWQANSTELRRNLRTWRQLPDHDRPRVGEFFFPTRSPEDDALPEDESIGRRVWRVRWLEDMRQPFRLRELQGPFDAIKIQRYMVATLVLLEAIVVLPGLILAAVFWCRPDPEIIPIELVLILPLIGLAPGTALTYSSLRWSDHGILRPTHAFRLALSDVPRELTRLAFIAAPMFVSLYLLGFAIESVLHLWYLGLTIGLAVRIFASCIFLLDRSRTDTVTLILASLIYTPAIAGMIAWGCGFLFGGGGPGGIACFIGLLTCAVMATLYGWDRISLPFTPTPNSVTEMVDSPRRRESV